jgi:hypothetical protein
MARDNGEIKELLNQVDEMIDKAITLDLKLTLYLLQIIKLELSTSIHQPKPSAPGRRVLVAQRTDSVKSSK